MFANRRALAIVVPPVGTQRDSRVQVALTISWPAKAGAFQDGFFELCVCDLALRVSMYNGYTGSNLGLEEGRGN